MLKNGKLYGSIIPPDVNSLRIRDVSLGEKLSLQLIALTEHPVGKGDNRAASITGDKDSGIGGSTTQPEERSAGKSLHLFICICVCVYIYMYNGSSYKVEFTYL